MLCHSYSPDGDLSPDAKRCSSYRWPISLKCAGTLRKTLRIYRAVSSLRLRLTLHMILFCFLIAFQWSEDPLSSPIIFVESNRDGHFVLPNLTMDNPINSLSLRKAFNLSQNQTYHCQQMRMSLMTSILME